jgi:hypothetical protein
MRLLLVILAVPPIVFIGGLLMVMVFTQSLPSKAKWDSAK